MADDVESKSQDASEELGGAKKVATKKKVVKKKGTSSGKTNVKTKTAKASAGVDENVITLAELAEEADVSPSVARAKLRRAELENPGRWSWKRGSSGEKAARKILEI